MFRVVITLMFALLVSVVSGAALAKNWNMSQKLEHKALTPGQLNTAGQKSAEASGLWRVERTSGLKYLQYTV